uniref:Uncharacterized protein n=1 Tax=Amphimedon queenslandica TaxID=400682 RepID=A0A1X7TG29_AMPQE
MRRRPLIRRESIDGSGNKTRISQISTSSNDACTIEATQLLPEVEIVQQASMLQSCGNNNASSQPQFDMESMCYAFDELHKLLLDRSGLVYHCSQYGVTLIIPEGAVQESATVWFGACLFSDKFKFGDYVPVTPIVWVHIDRKLDKCAELYIPHDVAISSEINLQQFTVLTAHDDDCSDVISFQENYGSQQQGCTEVVEEQCAKEGFKILSYEPVTFTGDGQVSLSFEPPSVPGWKREQVGFIKDHVCK